MTESIPSPAAPPARLRWRLLFGVWLLYSCFGLTIAGLAPLVGPITRDLGLSHSEMGSVLGVWQLTYILAAVPCGALLDRLGAYRALILGAVVIALSGLIRSIATDFWTLCLGVGLFGLGGPIISSGAPKVVSRWFHGRDRGFAMGIYITGPAVGSMLALSTTNSLLMPALGGDWRRVLQVWAIVCIVGGLAWAIAARHPAARKEDAATAGPRLSQWQMLGAILRLPAVRLLLAMGVGIFMFNHGLNNWLPELLRSSGMTAAEAGYWATVPTVVGILGSLIIPRLATPARRFAILGILAVCAALAGLMLHADAGPVLLAGLILQGIARSSLMTLAILALVETPEVGERHAGTASGLFFSAAEIGGAGGPIVLGVLYDATGGFQAGLGLLTSIAVLLLLGTWRLRTIAARGASRSDM